MVKRSGLTLRKLPILEKVSDEAGRAVATGSLIKALPLSLLAFLMMGVGGLAALGDDDVGFWVGFAGGLLFSILAARALWLGLSPKHWRSLKKAPYDLALTAGKRGLLLDLPLLIGFLAAEITAATSPSTAEYVISIYAAAALAVSLLLLGLLCSYAAYRLFARWGTVRVAFLVGLLGTSVNPALFSVVTLGDPITYGLLALAPLHTTINMFFVKLPEIAAVRRKALGRSQNSELDSTSSSKPEKVEAAIDDGMKWGLTEDEV